MGVHIGLSLHVTPKNTLLLNLVEWQNPLFLLPSNDHISQKHQPIFSGSDTWVSLVSLAFFQDRKLLEGLITHELSCLEYIRQAKYFFRPLK